MNDELEKEIQDALTHSGEDHTLEMPISEDQSPLNSQVKTGDIADLSDTKTKKTSFRKTAQDAYVNEQTEQIIADAPEQHIGGHSEGSSQEKETVQAVISDKQATQTAQALLGMADNFLAVGGGFFVKITKHEEFFEFEELVEVIDSQNEKNIKRIRLDDDDKALLTPLLAQVIKNKTKQLTPEQQLLGAIISVIVKKAQTVMEVRAENRSLEGRILQIVREAKLPEATNQEQTIAEKEVEDTSDNDPMASEEQFSHQAEEELLEDLVEEGSEIDEPEIFAMEHPIANEMTGMHIAYEEVDTSASKKATPSQRVKKQTQKRIENHKKSKDTGASNENDDSS